MFEVQDQSRVLTVAGPHEEIEDEGRGVVKGGSSAHIRGAVCPPAQRKPLGLIVIKTLPFRYLPLTNKALGTQF